MSDKVKEQRQYNFQKAKYIGVGDPNTTRMEFMEQVHKDSYSSIVHHQGLALYNSLALDTDVEKVKFDMIKKISKPFTKPVGEHETKLKQAKINSK